MKFSKLLILLLVLTPFCSAEWYNNQTDACNYCGQMVFGLLLQNDVETLISTNRLVSKYNFCPNYAPGWQLDSCVAFLDYTFSFFYRIYYAINFPIRDYICVPICGNSGENFEIIFKKRR
ncbi:Saposin B-type domain-containing protein [Caenorhabditis elegans]|uniref:Saposin B-type domain-containing protein n=1 Tax=Caenorhabditis elegans TaxID=6239 RepID=Q9U3T3_CAEEL|nr:Saposin B-type domain-containing protein [Caenorhabditis elegans]CAB60761.2 Saposin B-type domain-containing protein [Caenorhabditis elegans]|eukprot:NP_507819.1 Uncharacterized protein CELE_Y116F11A.3 [Caenorhabditis elegans]